MISLDVLKLKFSVYFDFKWSDLKFKFEQSWRLSKQISLLKIELRFRLSFYISRIFAVT